MGGNIEIATEQIFNLAERKGTDNNGTNDIDASSDFGVDGNVSIEVIDTDSIQGIVELPTGVIETKQANVLVP